MKPVQQEELFAADRRALRPPAADAEARGRGDGGAASPSATGPRALRVLLAEDNPFNQALMREMLEKRGHALRVAEDGREALAALEEGRFDVLLLDVHMPEVDGFQVVAALRRREEGTGRRLPVVALTARSTEGDRERCLRSGMDVYLAKPVRPAELFAVLDRVAAAGPDDAGAAGPIDPQALLAACDADDGLLQTMCRHFRSSLPARLAEAAEALRGRDPRRLREAAHKLGGMASSFSSSAADAAARLERLAAEGNVEEEARHALTRLAELTERLSAALATLTVAQLRRRQGPGGDPEGRR
jgi:CheY-like chemotaxis protein